MVTTPKPPIKKYGIRGKDFEDLRLLWKKITPLAIELANVYGKANTSKIVSNDPFAYAEGISNITDEGVVAYQMVNLQYNEGQEHATFVVTVHMLMNPQEYLDKWIAEYEANKKQEAKKRDFWEREQYERLRSKFENG